MRLLLKLGVAILLVRWATREVAAHASRRLRPDPGDRGIKPH